MNYNDSLRYLYSFLNFEIKTDYAYRKDFHLKRVRWLLNAFGDPQKKLRFVLVGGTKGKGATACILASILSSAGYRTGLYTSPHLKEVRERIRIGGEPVSKTDFAEVLRRIKNRLKRGVPAVFGDFTFFEILTVAAILHFSKKKVRLAVLEVGLGGRLDATNAVHPLVSVLTPISYDHMDKLGNSLTAIAGEKKSIVQTNGFLVCAEQPASVRSLLEKWARKQNAKAFFLRRDFRFRKDCLTELGSSFEMSCGPKRLKHLFLFLPGEFQIENAACAIQAAEILAVHWGFRIETAAFRKGLLNVSWEGRFQVLSRNPLVIADGAHNGASMRALRKSLKAIFPGRSIIVILGISNDKDFGRIFRELALLSPERVVVTQAGNVRAMPVRNLAERASGVFPEIQSAFSLKEALNTVLRSGHSENLFLITGSLFLVGEALTYWNARSECFEMTER